MKKSILIVIAVLSTLSLASAGEVNVKAKASAATCGQAGVKAYKACIAKSQEDIFEALEIKADFSKESIKEDGSCEVEVDCSFYLIIN